MPRFSLFLLSYGLQLVLTVTSTFSDIAPETAEAARKVRPWVLWGAPQAARGWGQRAESMGDPGAILRALRSSSQRGWWMEKGLLASTLHSPETGWAGARMA